MLELWLVGPPNCNCGAINSLSTLACGQFAVVDNRSTAIRCASGLLSALEKRAHSMFRFVEKRDDESARERMMRQSRHPFSCTSVHSSYPQNMAGAYRCVGAELARYRQPSTIAIHSSSNDLWKTFLLRFAPGFSRLPSPPTAKSPLDAIFSLPRTHNAPRQLRCSLRAARRRASVGVADRIDRSGTVGCLLVIGCVLRASHVAAGRD
jgi:hypothetical protein